MKVQFNKPMTRFNEKDYKKGIHHIEDEHHSHWYLQALVKDKDAVVVQAPKNHKDDEEDDDSDMPNDGGGGDDEELQPYDSDELSADSDDEQVEQDAPNSALADDADQGEDTALDGVVSSTQKAKKKKKNKNRGN